MVVEGRGLGADEARQVVAGRGQARSRGRAVIGLALRDDRRRQALGRDRARARDRGRQGVVGGDEAVDGDVVGGLDPAHRHRRRPDHIGVVVGARGEVDRGRLRADEARQIVAGRRQAQGRGRAVIDLGLGRQGSDQGRRGDRPRPRDRGRECVVAHQEAVGARVEAAGGDAADRHQAGGEHVRAVVGARGDVDRAGLGPDQAADRIVGRGQGRGAGPVIDLGRRPDDREGQGRRGDRAGSRDRGRQAVVGGQEGGAQAAAAGHIVPRGDAGDVDDRAVGPLHVRAAVAA